MTDIGILGCKKWRLRNGITLEQISCATKLSLRQLDAIETGDYKKLPGGVYTVNYIKQYAKFIGFDEADLLAYYHEAVAPPVVAPQEKRPPSRISRPLFQH